jgi:hypothetical protein
MQFMIGIKTAGNVGLAPVQTAKLLPHSSAKPSFVGTQYFR